MKFALAPYDDDSFSSSRVKVKIGDKTIANEVDEVPTHGGVSHFIKHALEFADFEHHWHEAAQFGREAFLKADDITILSFDEEPLTEKRLQNLGKEPMGCLLDLINDRKLSGDTLVETEELIFTYLEKKTVLFADYIEEQAGKVAARVGDNQHFHLAYEYADKVNDVYYRKEDTAMFVFSGGKIITAFRVNKTGGHDERVLKYFARRKLEQIQDVIAQRWGTPEEILGK